MRGILVVTVAAVVLLPVASVSAAGSTGTGARRVVHYVSLGDSVTTVTPSFVAMVARGASARLHRKVAVTNVLEDGNVSTLVDRVKSDATIIAAIRQADVITITIGGNELAGSVELDKKACGGSDGLRCVRAVEKSFEQSYRALIDRLVKLRSPTAAAYRLLTSYNAPSAFPARERSVFNSALRATNPFICAQAKRRAMKCADVYAAFNGKDGLRDPLLTGLVIQDGHPTAKGSALIAKVVTDLGFAPVH